MPTIPTSESFARRTPDLRTGVSVADLTPLAKADQEIAKGYQTLGKGIDILDRKLERDKLKEDTFDYGIARSKALQESITLEDQLKNTQDINTIQDVHQKGWNDIKSNALSQVSNPKLKEQLGAELNLQAEKDRIQAGDIFRAKRGDSDRAVIDEQLDGIKNAYASTTDEGKRQELLTTGNQIIEGAIARQSIDKETGQAVRSKLFEEVAVNRINSMPADEQAKVLGVNKSKSGEITFSKTGTFADNLSPDKKLTIYQQTQQAAKQKQDDYIAQLKKADFIRQRNAEENSMNIVLEGGTVNDIPLNQYALLNDSQRKNLDTIRQKQNNLLQTDPIEGIAAYNDYSRMYASDPQAFAKVDPTEIRANVSPDKVNEVVGWQNAALQGTPQNADESSFQQTANFYVKNVLPKKISREDSTLFTEKLRNAKQEFLTSKGRQPNNEELKYMANGLVSEVAVGGALWGTNPELLYKLEDDFNVPEENSDLIIERIKNIRGNSYIPTPEEIRKIYQKQLNKDVIKQIP